MSLKSFCCYFNLYPSVLFLSWLNIIFTLSALIASFFVLAHRQDLSLLIVLSPTMISLLALSVIFMTFIQIGINILLLNGLYKKNSRDLLPWLIVDGIGLLFIIFVLMIFLITSSATFFRLFGLSVIFVTYLYGSIFLGVSIFLWVAVHKLYKLWIEDDVLIPIHESSTDIE